MVAHFRNLFDVPMEEGVYARMNDVYIRLAEMQNVYRSLKGVLRLRECRLCGILVFILFFVLLFFLVVNLDVSLIDYWRYRLRVRLYGYFANRLNEQQYGQLTI